MDKADLILIQYFPAGQAIGKKNDIVRRSEPNHVKEMTGQINDFKTFGQDVFS